MKSKSIYSKKINAPYLSIDIFKKPLNLTHYKVYSSFGMVMQERSFSSPAYRWGFNGKEKDNEINVDAGDYDFGARIYDSRLNKFLSIDPLSHSIPCYSTYQFAGNKPIWAKDANGLMEQISTEGEPISILPVDGSSLEFNIKINSALSLLNASTIYMNNLKLLKSELGQIGVIELNYNPNDPTSKRASSFTYDGNGFINIPSEITGHKLELSISYEVQNLVNTTKYTSINKKVSNGKDGISKSEFVHEYFIVEAQATVTLMETAIELKYEKESEDPKSIAQYKKLTSQKGFDKQAYINALAKQLEKDNPDIKKKYEGTYEDLKKTNSTVNPKPSNSSSDTTNKKLK